MSSSYPNDPLGGALGSGSMSRRVLFRRGAGLAAVGLTPALLAACGGDDSSSSSSTAAEAPEEIGGTIFYLGYQGSDYPEPLKQFNKANGIKFESSYIGSMSDIPAKFAGGGNSGIDLIEFSAPGTLRLSQSGVDFQPLDVERIPNWKNVERFIDYTGSEPYENEAGEIVGAPISWGALGITYDSAAISEPKAWGDLLEPSFKGKITMIDDPSQNYDLAATILGFKSNELTQDQLQQTSDYLKKVLANCRKLSTSYGDMTNLLAAGEITAGFGGWTAVNAFAAEAGSNSIKTNLEPEEGSAIFVELYSLAPDSSNPDSIYAVINQLLEPKMNAVASDSLIEAATVTGAQALQSKAVSSLYPPESSLEKYFAKTSVAQDPPAISDEFVTFGEITEAWTQIKAEV